MAGFKGISEKNKKIMTADTFKGVDFTDSHGRIKSSRSPDAINMIRDSLGKVKKRFGYYTVNDFGECIYGIYYYFCGSDKKMAVHCGKKLYIQEESGFVLLYSDMNPHISTAVQFSGKLVIADGKTLLYYDGSTVGKISDIAYVPTVVLGREPSGGGVFYEEINMLGNKRIERFRGNGTDKKLYLTVDYFKNIVYVKKRRNNEWITLGAQFDYNCNFSKGYIELVLQSDLPSDGEDNYEVCYIVDNSDYLNILNSSSFMTLYGVSGALDRLFLGGNCVYPNRDYYSALNDPTYFPDVNFGVLGRDNSPIVGYSLVSDKLVAHKNNEINNANMIARYGSTDESGNAVFKITGTYIGSSALSNYGFGVIDNEPSYLSDEGICAITPSDILGERYSQVRSYYINGKLLKESNLQNAYVVSHNQFLTVLINEKIYILDSLTYSAEGSNTYSHRQYEGYLWDNIPANILFSDGNTLYFGCKDGKLCAFYKDEEENCYLDNGEAFSAYWQLPGVYGDDFSKRKTIMHIATWFDDNSANTKIQYYDGEWKDILTKKDGSAFLSQRVHIKDTKGAELRIINSHNEPLKLNSIRIVFINGSTLK